MGRLSAQPISYVYAIGGKTGLQKIGYSYDPRTRAICYRCGDGRRPLIHYEAEVPTKQAPKVERYAHRILGRYRADGEMFNVTPSMAVKAVQRAVMAVEAGLTLPTKKLRHFFAPKPPKMVRPRVETKVVALRLPPMLHEPLMRLAREHDRAPGYFVRKALAEYLAERRAAGTAGT